MKKRKLTFLLAGSLSVGIILSGCNNEPVVSGEQIEKATPVLVENIQRGNLTIQNEVIGKAASDSTVDVMPKMAGELKQIFVKKGDKVQKGDVLAVIDNKNQQLTVDMQRTAAKNAQQQYQQALVSKKQAETAVSNARLNIQQAELSVKKAKDGQATGINNSTYGVEQAQISLNDAQINYDRMKELYDAGLASKQQLEQVETALNQAKIALNQAQLQKSNAEKVTDIELAQQSVEQAKIGLLNAQQQLELANVSVNQAQVAIESNNLQIQQAELQLDDSKIVATANGEVTDVHYVVGDVVSSAAPFTTIVDLNNINIEAKISPNKLASFNNGQEVKVEIPALSETLTAKVSYISNVADEAGFYLLEAAIQNKDGKIKPGMVAKVITESSVVNNSLLVPTNAVIEQGEDSFVYVIQEERAVLTPVSIVRAQTELTAIEGEGINENTVVVTKGQNTLSDGNKVKIIEEEQA